MVAVHTLAVTVGNLPLEVGHIPTLEADRILALVVAHIVAVVHSPLVVGHNLT